jgi:hypothetical protein
MDMRVMATVQYVAESNLTSENIQYCLIKSAGSGLIDCYALSRNFFETSMTSFVQAVEAGYPLTTKVYAV